MASWSTGLASRENLSDQLLVELWTRIFECPWPNYRQCVNFCFHDGDRESVVAALLSDQARFHQLKLVCSRFRQVFLQHPELSGEAILAEDNASNLTPSLLL